MSDCDGRERRFIVVVRSGSEQEGFGGGNKSEWSGWCWSWWSGYLFLQQAGRASVLRVTYNKESLRVMTVTYTIALSIKTTLWRGP